MIPLQPKDIALAPIYLYQGLKLKRTALRLPEANGERKGSLLLSKADIDNSFASKDHFNLILVGDSSAAGVGVSVQQEALIGHLLSQLQSMPIMRDNFNQIDWALHATSGHTSFDMLRRLYVLPIPPVPVDVMVMMIGVNDTTTNVPLNQWKDQLRDIIDVSKRKFGAKKLIFLGLPPMQNMPAIPRPLNNFLGAKSERMNNKLFEVCSEYENVLALPIELENTGLSAEQLFAKDGFHPNSTAYYFLALKLAKNIGELL